MEVVLNSATICSYAERRPTFMIRVIILLILLIFSGQSFGQNSRLEEVDSYVDGLSLDKNISLNNLVTVLTKPFVYYWIAKNIGYDYEGAKTHYWRKYPSYDAMISDTYKLRKGICSGYSHLFKRMLSIARIECEVVNGICEG